MSMFSRHTGTQSTTWVTTLTNGPLQGRRETTMSVTLRHNTLTGSRQVLVDGEAIEESKGRSTVIGKSDIWIKVPRKDCGDTVSLEMLDPRCLTRAA